MARKYYVKGTKDYLVWALVLLVLALWFMWDGWFPREAVLERHPDPEDHFYLFNKSVAVLLFLGAAVCLYIHVVVK